MERPSLHEIAAMPFPASRNAMREHYNPHWGKEVPEDGQKRKFKVQVEYSIPEYFEATIEAFSKDEAREEALEDLPADAEIEVVNVMEIGGEA